MKKLRYRNELKHYINSIDCILLKNKLTHIMQRDQNSRPDGKYLIRSLYFDTPDDKALIEKITGVDNREKFRLRFYNHDTNFVRLEKKSKINGFTNKISSPISKNQCELIQKGEIEWLYTSGNKLFMELYSKIVHQRLMPTTVVDYEREAYIYKPGNVRVTIDSSIRTGLRSTNFFDKNLPTIEALDNNLSVLEVKYDNFLPEVIGDIVQIGERHKLSVSKYALCRIYC